MSVLLSDEQINKLISNTLKEHYREQNGVEKLPKDYSEYELFYTEGGESNAIAYQSCKAQLKAVIEYLEQPCTEHPIGEYHCGKPEPKAPVVKWVYKLGFLYLHRRDCPVCWAELKGEL